MKWGYKRLSFWHSRFQTRAFKPVVLITGCSSGIGLSLARVMKQAARYRVVVTARLESLDILRQGFLEDENFWIHPLDVVNAQSRKDLMAAITQRWGGVDILINNAGISYRSTLEEMDESDEELQMATNYFGPIALIRLCLPWMRQQGRGKIINVSSVSGMLAMPTMASYSASKYALEGASEALWYEVRPFGINVSLIQPGFVRSQSFLRVKYSRQSSQALNTDGPYSLLYKSMEPFIAKLMHRGLATADSVAQLTLDVIRTQNPPLWIPASLDAEFFYYLRRWLPRRFLQPILFLGLPQARKWGTRHTHRRPNYVWPLNWIRGLWQKFQDPHE